MSLLVFISLTAHAQWLKAKVSAVEMLLICQVLFVCMGLFIIALLFFQQGNSQPARSGGGTLSRTNPPTQKPPSPPMAGRGTLGYAYLYSYN